MSTRSVPSLRRIENFPTYPHAFDRYVFCGRRWPIIVNHPPYFLVRFREWVFLALLVLRHARNRCR